MTWREARHTLAGVSLIGDVGALAGLTFGGNMANLPKKPITPATREQAQKIEDAMLNQFAKLYPSMQWRLLLQLVEIYEGHTNREVTIFDSRTIQ